MGGASHARAGLGSAGRGLLQAWVLLQGEALWGWRGGGLLPRLCFSPFRPDVFLFKDIFPQNIPPTHTPVHPYTPNTLWKQNQAFSPSERGACMGENKKVQGRGEAFLASFWGRRARSRWVVLLSGCGCKPSFVSPAQGPVLSMLLHPPL